MMERGPSLREHISAGAKTISTLFEYPSIIVILKKVVSRSPWRMALPNRYYMIKYYGGKIYLNLSESGMMMDRALGVYDYWKTKLFLKLVKEGMTIADIGVNKGYFSLLFAKLMNDRGRVLSFEPDPDNCFWFKRSIRANKYRCIRLFQCTLSNRQGKVAFYRGKKSGWGSLFPSSRMDGKAITVKTRKLDDVLRDEGISRVDIIKIDVEGADLLVLEGAERTLNKKNIKLIMDIDVRNSQKKNRLFTLLESHGFKIFRIGKELIPIEKIDERTKDIFAAKL